MCKYRNRNYASRKWEIKMKIRDTRKNKGIEFEGVKIGQVFVIDNQYYIKVDGSYVFNESFAVNLETGNSVDISPKVVVHLVNAELLIGWSNIIIIWVLAFIVTIIFFAIMIGIFIAGCFINDKYGRGTTAIIMFFYIYVYICNAYKLYNIIVGVKIWILLMIN